MIFFSFRTPITAIIRRKKKKKNKKKKKKKKKKPKENTKGEKERKREWCMRQAVHRRIITRKILGHPRSRGSIKKF